MMFDRRLVENFDWIFLSLLLALAGLGILNLYSASAGFQTGGAPIYLKQVYWLLFGLGGMVVILFFHYHLLKDWAYWLYAAGLVLLFVVLVNGRITSGAQRWIDFGFFRFQPAELVKIFVVAALAKYFSRREYPDGLGIKELIGPALLIGLPFCLICQQPDLGTALHLAIACLSVVLFLRVRRSVITVSGLIVVTAMPLIWSLFLKSYQKQRIFTFFNPEVDRRGAGYHIIQSKIAVGSGQFWGKGFMKGTQSQLRFLPEQHTDFAFSVFAEEWGFAGSIVLLTLYLLLILRGLQIVSQCRDRFGALLALGVVALLFWQLFINLCMVIGLMPVVGIPLPLVSYGGTSMVVTLLAAGLLLNISMRRYLFQE